MVVVALGHMLISDDHDGDDGEDDDHDDDDNDDDDGENDDGDDDDKTMHGLICVHHRQWRFQ